MICFFLEKKHFLLATILEKAETIVLQFVTVTRNSILPDL